MLHLGKVALAVLVSTTLIGASKQDVVPVQTLEVPLSGQAELNFAHPSGGTGDLDGSGSVRLTIHPAGREVCYDLKVDGVATPMLAYIHQGSSKRIGPPVVGLFYGVGSNLNDCVPANTGRLSDMIENPSLYYVSVATTEYPDGALRGQLSTS